MSAKLRGRRGERLDTITVEELILELEQLDKNLPVVLSYNYGDYSHTEAIDPIMSVIAQPIEPGAYSRSGFIVREPDPDDDSDEADDDSKALMAVVISRSRS